MQKSQAAIEMTLAAAISALESGFDPFLQSVVREDPDGIPLTVLSVLARLDLDPWEEVARLAQLPTEAAAQAALPGDAATSAEGGTIAARLVTLLPHGSSATSQRKESHLADRA
jgi:hypothetical protein